MSYYEDVYRKRLNRYGNDYQSRMQAKREKNFESFLLQSVFRVDFEYEGVAHPGILKRYKQDETETLQYLLTRKSLKIEPGTFLDITKNDGQISQWLVFWFEDIASSGYNRYVLLKMTQTIKWKGSDGGEHTTLAYFIGKGKSAIKDTIISGNMGSSSSAFLENNNLNCFITAINGNIHEEDYFETSAMDKKGAEVQQAFRVTGYDFLSSKGIEYVSVDPTYHHDKSPLPDISGSDEDSFWFNGGLK